MNYCKICGSPYIVTTDCRCQNCLNKIEIFTLPIIDKYGRVIIKEFNCL